MSNHDGGTMRAEEIIQHYDAKEAVFQHGAGMLVDILNGTNLVSPATAETE